MGDLRAKEGMRDRVKRSPGFKAEKDVRMRIVSSVGGGLIGNGDPRIEVRERTERGVPLAVNDQARVGA